MIVEQIDDLLKKDGFDTWRDKVAMPYAVNWDDAVIEAICQSSFAVIFDSKARAEKMTNPNSACQREYEWIQDAGMTYVEIDLDDPNNSSPEFVKNSIECWIAKEEKENGHRIKTIRNLVSAGYAAKYGKITFGKNDIPVNLIGRLFKLYELSQSKKLLISNPDLGIGQLGIRNYIFDYLKQFKKRIISKIYMRFLVIAVAIIVIVYGAKSLKQFLYSTQYNEAMSKETNEYNLISDSVNTDLIFGASLMNSDLVSSFYTKYHNYFDVLNRKYPCAYYVSGTETELLIKELRHKESNGIEVVFNSNNGIVNVNDKNNGNSSYFVIDGVPTDYDVSDDGRYIAIASSNKVYVGFTGSAYAPDELCGNYEQIENVYCKDNSIYGITASGNVVVWDESDILSKQAEFVVESCQMHNCISNARAVFVSDSKLVINNDNTFEQIDLPKDIDDIICISLSQDGEHVIILGKTKEENCQLYDVDCETKQMKLEYSTKNNISCAVWGHDTSQIIFYDASESTLNRLELYTQAIKKSKSFWGKAYTIEPHAGGYVLGMNDGFLYCVDDDLKVVAPETSVLYGNIAKHISVSDKYGEYYVVSRNGNNYGGFGIYYLTGKDKSSLVRLDNVDMLANSAIAVSNSEDYVAIGFDNGNIVIYTLKGHYPVWMNSQIKEGILDISFDTDDESIYALGKSGTVYREKLGKQITDCKATDNDSQVRELQRQAEELYYHMSSLGLTDISEDEFYLKREYTPK